MPFDGTNYRAPENPWPMEDEQGARTIHASPRAVLDAFEQAFQTGLVYYAVMGTPRNIQHEGDAHRDAQCLAECALDSYVTGRIEKALASKLGDGR